MVKKLIPLFLLIILISCNFPKDYNIGLSFTNKSSVTIDSIYAFDILKRPHKFYNIKPGTTVEKKIKLKNFLYPKKDTYAFQSFAFFGGVFYFRGQGIIDPPFGLLETEYHYFIWDKGMSSKFNPEGWKYSPPLKINKENLTQFNYFQKTD